MTDIPNFGTEEEARLLARMLASYGKCKFCGEGFWFGQSMRWVGGHTHADCADKAGKQ